MIRGSVVMLCALGLLGVQLPVAAEAASTLHCEQGKLIERSLGRAGFRVVASGGYERAPERPVKVQIWEHDNRDWVITEAYMARNRTCVVRAGVKLHMLY